MSRTDDLYPTKLVVKNLYCFRGTHTLQLGADVYAVLAQAADNPARSNWLGKSTLLMAFAFALTGWHTKRTDDEIVTNGETEASVELWLNDGSYLSRTKILGKSMQVRFTAKGKRGITQARAQEAIEKHIGFSKDDFFATCFFEQKQIGALVTAKAAERTSMVEGWLAEELEPIQRLHGAAVRRHNAASAALLNIEREMQVLRTDWDALVEEQVGHSLDKRADLDGHLDAKLCKAEATRTAKRQELKKTRDELVTAKAEARTWEAKVRQAAEYDALVKKGMQVRAEFDAIPANINAQANRHAEEINRLGAVKDDAVAYCQDLENGQLDFDGTCPVTCKDCPSREWVVAQGVTDEALEEAKKASTTAREAFETAFADARPTMQQDSQRTKLDKELVRLRAKAEELMDVAAEVEEGQAPAGTEELEERLTKLEGEMEVLAEQVCQLKIDIGWAANALARMEELDGDLVAAKAKAEVTAEAVAITGRTGAQQAIQELAMAKVERRANTLLANAGIPLQVNISWAQETKGLAKVCSCGAAFPTSQRVKACPSCGAVRSPNTQRKLSIEPSNRSGAAEDLAGIALGIAASQWLRATRGSRWDTVFIDEPFGALDEHNRAALSSHIVSMLRTAFSSAYVVAHERAILSAMPARITIIGSANGSQIQGAAT